MRWSYRVGQFLARAFARQAAMDYATARQVLPAAAYTLFERLSPGDQRHALCVLSVLEQAGSVSPDLAQAALLHDVGKADGQLTLVHRTAVVLLKAVGSEWLARIARDDPHSWRYAFYVQEHHAALGAIACQTAGCSPDTVALIRHHEMDRAALLEDAPWLASLVALQRADDRC